MPTRSVGPLGVGQVLDDRDQILRVVRSEVVEAAAGASGAPQVGDHHRVAVLGEVAGEPDGLALLVPRVGEDPPAAAVEQRPLVGACLEDDRETVPEDVVLAEVGQRLVGGSGDLDVHLLAVVELDVLDDGLDVVVAEARRGELAALGHRDVVGRSLARLGVVTVPVAVRRPGGVVRRPVAPVPPLARVLATAGSRLGGSGWTSVPPWLSDCTSSTSRERSTCVPALSTSVSAAACTPAIGPPSPTTSSAAASASAVITAPRRVARETTGDVDMSRPLGSPNVYEFDARFAVSCFVPDARDMPCRCAHGPCVR
jgi:hypothetical protein